MLCCTAPALPLLLLLQVLNLSGNSIGPTLPPHVSRLTSLHTLVLSSNHLLELPRFVKSLTRLSHLDVASNKLQVGLWLACVGKVVVARVCTVSAARVREISAHGP